MFAFDPSGGSRWAAPSQSFTQPILNPGGHMIDTVRLFSPHRIRWEPSLEWDFKVISKRRFDHQGKQVIHEYPTFTHIPTGLRAWGMADEIKWIEASLPRVLHGTNGKLLIDDNEIQDALAKVKQIVREIGTPLIYDEYFNRIDLVWQFRGNPADFLAAHHDLRHGKVRRQTSHYDDQGVTWPGSGLLIRMYDKLQEMTGKSGDVVRVEVQLRGNRLRQQMADETGQVTELNFDRCYQIYRDLIVSGFKPAPLSEIRGLDDFLAAAVRNGWNEDGLPAFDMWARGKNPRYVQAKRSMIAKIVLRTSSIDWNQLLPEDEYPPLVEMEADGGGSAQERDVS
jgi:hypothetical protein